LLGRSAGQEWDTSNGWFPEAHVPPMDITERMLRNSTVSAAATPANPTNTPIDPRSEKPGASESSEGCCTRCTGPRYAASQAPRRGYRQDVSPESS
jgi:hypothetical protein